MDRHSIAASQAEEVIATTPPTQSPSEFSLEPFSWYDTLVWIVQALVSAVGLVLLSPLMFLIALAIKLTDGGPVFYRGERVGQGRHPFKIYKFRTLIEEAEQRIGGRLLSDADRDVYCTKVGRFLKRTKLDELPQLLNIIRGEMRLVGPRPLRPVFLEQFEREIPRYLVRFLVPPGLTGIAQLRGGYYTSPRNKLRYDLVYIRNRSFLLDWQVIVLTFVKILNRWLTRGFFFVFLFLFASLVPPDVQPLLSVSFFGIEVSLVYLLIILVSGWFLFTTGPTHFSLYRSPLNLPALCFIILSLLSAFFVEDPFNSLQRAGYLVVTGFLVSFLILNSLTTTGFMTVMVRIIALTSVVISLFGLFQFSLMAATFSEALSTLPHEGNLLGNYTRISSLFGSPVVLSVYLVLGIPLLLAEVTQSHSQRERDFWLVCTTISCIGLAFTQTRVGLLAFLVIGTVFLARRPRHAFAFASIFLFCLLFIMSLGAPRFSTGRLGEDVKEWIQEDLSSLRTIPMRQWLIGGKAITTSPLQNLNSQLRSQQSGENDEIANMHIVLAAEHGISGWLIIMWLIFSALWAMKQVHARTADERLKSTLWAIISSVLGFLISMNGMNTFHNLTLQIFFWSLIGIGLGIVIRLNGHRRHNLIWRFGDAGD